MLLLGKWEDPLGADHHHTLIADAARKANGTCAYCGFRTPISPTLPYAGLRACVIEPGLPVEPNNIVVLCGFCANMNSLSNLDGKGRFVELPWFTQSQLTNILRTIYCVQLSTDRAVTQTSLYRGSNALLKNLSRNPREWTVSGFDGTPASLKRVLLRHTGYTQSKSDRPQYINRLRFMFSPEPFETELREALATIEAQVISGD